jgi:hypothetical protein
MAITIPDRIAPATPITYEYIGQFLETQVQAALLESTAATTGPFLGWAFDAAHAGGTAILGAAGSVYGTAITLPQAATVAKLWYDVTTAGNTLTTGDCWALLFNSAGTLIGQSADQHTIWGTAGIGGTAAGGTVLTASATGSLTNLTAGTYYGAVVATGSTLPTFATSGAPQLAFNANLAAASSRCAILATSITSTPANVTPGSFAQTGSLPIWFALS